MAKGELVVYEGGPTDIAVARPPEVVLEEAHRAAKALTDVLANKKKKIIMNGEQYLEFEDWQTVGRFYGVTSKVVSTEFIDYGGVKGFLAKAVVLRQDGQEISAAEAMCLNDEEKWSSRPKYEWRGPSNDRQRVKVGDDPVPLFQLRSMAQTRACAKALRNVLAWVVVLAGYKPTPAEEMDGVEGTHTVEVKPAPGSSPSSPGAAKPEGGTGQPAPGSPSQAAEPKDDAEKRQLLTVYAMEYAEATGGTLKQAIEHFSGFPGTDKKTGAAITVSRDDASKLSGKWLNTAYGKAKQWHQENAYTPPANEGQMEDVPLFETGKE